MTSAEFLLLVKTRLNCSYYQIAKILDIPPNRISSAKNGRYSVPEKHVIQLCKLINVDPATILPGIVAEGINDPEKRKVWERVSDLVARGSATLSGVFLVAPALLHGIKHCILC